MVVEEVARLVFWPNGPERSSCVPDSSQAMSSGCCVWFVVEIKAKKQDLAVLVRPGQANPEYAFRGSVRRVLARSEGHRFHPGRRGLHFGMSGIVLAQIEPRAVRRGLGGLAGLEDLGTGRRQSVLRTKRAVAAMTKNASATNRKSIPAARLC